jgi:hypothetical protein
LRTKFWSIFPILLVSLSLATLAYAQTGSVYFKKEFNYISSDQMQTAGWAFTRPAGISLSENAVILDGTGGDCSVHYTTSFSNPVYDWKAEVRGMWLGHGHSVLSVFVYTEKHSYGWAADGYYKYFSLYRDSQKILHFGNYQETANQYVTLTMIRQGDTFSFYFNGELINTYTEQDTNASKVISVDLVSPWRGDAKYDYFQVGEPNAVFPTSTPAESTNSFPMFPVVIGGGITAAIVGGIVIYYFFVAGGSGASAGASVGGGIGSAGAGSSGGGEGGSGVEQNVPPLPGSITATGVANVGSQPIASGQAATQTIIPSISETFSRPPPPGSLHPDAYNTPPITATGVANVGSQPIASGQAGATDPQSTLTGTGFGDTRSVNLNKVNNSSKSVQPDSTSDGSE